MASTFLAIVSDAGGGNAGSTASGVTIAALSPAIAHFLDLGDHYPNASTATMKNMDTSYFSKGISKAQSIGVPGNHDNGDSGSTSRPSAAAWKAYFTGTLTNVTGGNVPGPDSGAYPNTDQFIDVAGWRLFFIQSGGENGGVASPGWPDSNDGTFSATNPRVTWLRSNWKPGNNNLVFTHHLPYSAWGNHHDNKTMDNLLAECLGTNDNSGQHALLLVGGHDHNMQIYKPFSVDASGRAIKSGSGPGMVEVVAGGCGSGHYTGAGGTGNSQVSALQFLNDSTDGFVLLEIVDTTTVKISVLASGGGAMSNHGSASVSGSNVITMVAGAGGGGGGSAPTNLTVPNVTPNTNLVVGSVLATTNGTWTGTPTSFSYKWQRVNVSTGIATTISAATSSSYTVVSADLGFEIQALVQASNATGPSTFIQSNFTTAVGASGGGVSSLPDTAVDVAPPQFTGGDVLRGTKIGTAVYVGGNFSSVSQGGSIVRNNIAAYSVASNNILGWNPNTDLDVYHICAGPSGKVFICGAFTTVNGVARNSVALITDVTGSNSPTVDTTFVPPAVNANVFHCAYDPTALAGDGALYIAGDFTTVGGSSRTYFACLNARTGALQAWSPVIGAVNTAYHPGRRVMLGKHSTDQTDIYIVGAFGTVNGSARVGIAAVAKSPTSATPTLAAWAPDVQGHSTGVDSGTQGHDIDIKPDGTKLVVAYAGGGTGLDGNHGVAYQLVVAGTLNRQNTRLWTASASGDTGDHNSCACDDNFCSFGHHGNGALTNAANTDGLGNPKCYIVKWTVQSGSGLTAVPVPSGWIQNQFSGTKGVFTLQLADDRFLVGGNLTAPQTGLNQFDRVVQGGGGGGTTTYQYRIDGGAFTATGNSGINKSALLSGLTVGTHTFEVQTIDSVLGAGPLSIYVWDIKTSGGGSGINPPVIVSATDGTGADVLAGETTQDTELLITYTTDASTSVFISTNGGTTFVGPYTSPADITNLPVGVVNVVMQARDSLNNFSPNTTFTYIIQSSTGQGGTGSGLYTKQIVLPSVAGSSVTDTIYVRATDLNGTPVTTQVQRSVVVQVPLGTTPPAVSVLSPVDGSTVFSVDGSVDVLVDAENSNDTVGGVQITVDGVAFIDCLQQPDPSLWIGTIILPLGVGSTITAIATDATDGLQGTDSVTVLQSTATAQGLQFIPAPTVATNKPVEIEIFIMDFNQKDVGVIFPQDVEYVEQLNSPPTITFGMNLEDSMALKQRIDPDLHDWRLQRNGSVIGAGILAQSGVQIDTDSRTMTVQGQGYLGYFAYQFMLYDPTAEITGQNLSFFNQDLFNVTRSVVDSVVGGANSIPITYDHALSGIMVTQQFQASDLNDLLNIVTNLGGQVQGFDFEVTPECHFKMHSPQKGTYSSLILEHGRNIQSVKYSNPGSKANRVNAVGSGTASSQTVALAQNKANQARTRLYTDVAQFSNLTSFNQINGLAKSQLSLDLQNQVTMTVVSRPSTGEDQYQLASVGDWVKVKFDLEYVNIDDWFRMTQRSFKPDNEGNEIIEYQFSPNTINMG